MKLSNIEFQEAKIKLYGQIKTIEGAAQTYFEAFGYDVYVAKDYSSLYQIQEKYKGKKFKELSNCITTGVPDLIAIKGNDIIFIEVKRIKKDKIYHLQQQDSLRQSQLKWIAEHPQYKVIIFGLECDIEPSINKEIETKEIEIEKLNKEINELKQEKEAREDVYAQTIKHLPQIVLYFKRNYNLFLDFINSIECNSPIHIDKTKEGTNGDRCN